MLHRTVSLYRNSFGGLSKEIWLLALVTLINRSGTMVVPFMTVYLTTAMGFSLQHAGWVMTCFGLGSVLGNLLGGKLTDKFGFYPIQFWSLFLSGLMFLVLQYAQGLVEMCVAVFVLSLIADAFRPANHASIAVYSRAETRTRSYSLIRLAINLGFSIGPALGGLLAAAYGFHWLFWADGITCILAALLLRLFLENKKEVVPTKGDVNSPLPNNASPYRDQTFLVFISFVALSGIVFMQLFSMIPVYCKSHFQMSENQIGLVLGLNGLIIALLEMPLVYVLEKRVINKLRMVGLGVVLMGFSYVVLNIASDWTGMIIIFAVTITFGEILMMPFSNVFALERSAPETRGQYMALYSSTWSLAQILSPAMGAQIAAHWGFPVLWYILGLFCIIAFIGFNSLNNKQLQLKSV